MIPSFLHLDVLQCCDCKGFLARGLHMYACIYIYIYIYRASPIFDGLIGSPTLTHSTYYDDYYF